MSAILWTDTHQATHFLPRFVLGQGSPTPGCISAVFWIRNLNHHNSITVVFTNRSWFCSGYNMDFFKITAAVRSHLLQCSGAVQRSPVPHAVPCSYLMQLLEYWQTQNRCGLLCWAGLKVSLCFLRWHSPRKKQWLSLKNNECAVHIPERRLSMILDTEHLYI